MSRAKRCNSQDIFLTKDTKEARLSDGGGWGSGGREEEDHYGPPRGSQSYGGNGMRAWEDDMSLGKGKGKSWEEAFAAGYAMAASKGWGKASYGSWDGSFDRRGGKDRSRSPTGFWSSGGGGKSGGKYANFGSSGSKSGGKNGDGWKGKGKGTRKGKGGGKGKRDEEDEEVRHSSSLDADLDKYFGKETTASAPGPKKNGKGSGKDSNVNSGDLDSQLNDYFGNDKKPELEAERKATIEEQKGPTAASGEAADVPKPVAEEGAAAETTETKS